jgi:putative hydrolase of the HAD superfamily
VTAVPRPVEVVALDGDDTLWHHENLYQDTQAALRELLARHVDGAVLDNHLLDVERRNLSLFGYGVKGFVLSMIETAVELTGGAVSGTEIGDIVERGKSMLRHPVELIDGVADTVEHLADSYRLVLITKGDLFDQEGKIARSGLADMFERVEVLSEKDVAAYRRVFTSLDVPTSRVMMVGNSVRSDVLPALDAGARAVHVPYHVTWELEHAEPLEHHRVVTLPRLADLPAYLELLEDG